MPTPLPRINIVVTPELHELLSELGELQGRSMASYVRELVDAAQPLLEGLLMALQASQAADRHISARYDEALTGLAEGAFSGKLDGEQIDLEALIAAIGGTDACREGAQRRASGASNVPETVS